MYITANNHPVTNATTIIATNPVSTPETVTEAAILVISIPWKILSNKTSVPEGAIADQLNLSVTFSCSANSQPIEKPEELNWLTITIFIKLY